MEEQFIGQRGKKQQGGRNILSEVRRKEENNVGMIKEGTKSESKKKG